MPRTHLSLAVYCICIVSSSDSMVQPQIDRLEVSVIWTWPNQTESRTWHTPMHTPMQYLDIKQEVSCSINWHYNFVSANVICSCTYCCKTTHNTLDSLNGNCVFLKHAPHKPSLLADSVGCNFGERQCRPTVTSCVVQP